MEGEGQEGRGEREKHDGVTAASRMTEDDFHSKIF